MINFLQNILRFEDVVLNYITACFARLDMDEALFRDASQWNWSPILCADEKLRRYLNEGEGGLPKKYKGVDFFAADKGYKAIRDAAAAMFTDQSVEREEAKFTELPSDVNWAIYEANAVEPAVRIGDA